MAKYISALRSLLGFTLGSAAQEPHPQGSATAMAQPYADFGFDVLRTLSAGPTNDNIFVSPYSVAVSLAMLSNGANGQRGRQF